jgi:hypothetical protein
MIRLGRQPDSLEIAPALRWKRWQQKLGLTLGSYDNPVPLWRTGLRHLTGADEVGRAH